MGLLVIRAANILQVDELEIFRLAHRFNHLRTDEDATVHLVFKQYLENKIAPPWVTQYARLVVQTYNRGGFDPAMFGILPTYDRMPWCWSLLTQTPRYVRLNQGGGIFLA